MKWLCLFMLFVGLIIQFLQRRKINRDSRFLYSAATFCSMDENREHMEELAGTNSLDIPVEFMEMMRAYEEWKR